MNVKLVVFESIVVVKGLITDSPHECHLVSVDVRNRNCDLPYVRKTTKKRNEGEKLR